mmetsp:Transcript_67309/g.206145  ORF Transcript_67309/g.206145 Transcript_67309/m.206145 type:complete len:269 (+) Transcript_67309:3295-4101(+)
MTLAKSRMLNLIFATAQTAKIGAKIAAPGRMAAISRSSRNVTWSKVERFSKSFRAVSTQARLLAFFTCKDNLACKSRISGFRKAASWPDSLSDDVLSPLLFLRLSKRFHSWSDSSSFRLSAFLSSFLSSLLSSLLSFSRLPLLRRLRLRRPRLLLRLRRALALAFLPRELGLLLDELLMLPLPLPTTIGFGAGFCSGRRGRLEELLTRCRRPWPCVGFGVLPFALGGALGAMLPGAWGCQVPQVARTEQLPPHPRRAFHRAKPAPRAA